MIQLSPAYTTSITEAVNHDLWTPQEQAEMIARHEARELRLVVKLNPDAGRYLILTGGGHV
jgi:hypothetical protein